MGRPLNPLGRGTAVWIKPHNIKALIEKYPNKPLREIVNGILEEVTTGKEEA
jgi:hypothetical protein